MTFEERINKVIKDRAATKAAVAKQMGIPYTTFSYKCKDIHRMSVLEFKKLSEVLRLTEEEEDFLCDRVK